MISRKSTTKLALLYQLVFTNTSQERYLESFDFQSLWEYWYEQDIEGWFLDSIIHLRGPEQFRQMVLGLHTGATFNTTAIKWDVKEDIGQRLLMQLTIAVLKFHGPDLDNIKVKDDSKVIITRALVRQLELDGYVYRNENLYPAESTVIAEKEEQSYLEQLIEDLTLSDKKTVVHHLKLSEEHFVNGKWDDSISNSRKVLDAILKQVTDAVHIKVESQNAPSGLLKNATQTREYLERHGLVTTVERATLDKTYGLLSVTGGHPYIAEKDQARLMRHLALTFSQFVLLRYQGFLANNP